MEILENDPWLFRINRYEQAKREKLEQITKLIHEYMAMSDDDDDDFDNGDIDNNVVDRKIQFQTNNRQNQTTMMTKFLNTQGIPIKFDWMGKRPPQSTVVNNNNNNKNKSSKTRIMKIRTLDR